MKFPQAYVLDQASAECPTSDCGAALLEIPRRSNVSPSQASQRRSACSR